MVGFKSRALEGLFLSVCLALKTARDVITEATLMSSKSVARISDVGRFMETVSAFQHVSGFNNNNSKNIAPFHHDNTKVTC